MDNYVCLQYTVPFFQMCLMTMTEMKEAIETQLQEVIFVFSIVVTIKYC